MLIDTTEPYDPTWLVKLAKEQFPEIPQLAEDLVMCTKIIKPVMNFDPNRSYYIYFREENPELRGGNIIIDVDGKHTVVLDVFKDYKIIGVEYLTNICLKNARTIVIDA
jgi:hypothetical protein